MRNDYFVSIRINLFRRQIMLFWMRLLILILTIRLKLILGYPRNWTILIDFIFLNWWIRENLEKNSKHRHIMYGLIKIWFLYWLTKERFVYYKRGVNSKQSAETIKYMAMFCCGQNKIYTCETAEFKVWFWLVKTRITVKL